MDEENKNSKTTSDETVKDETTKTTEQEVKEVSQVEVKEEPKIEPKSTATAEPKANAKTEKPKKKKKTGLIVSIVFILIATIGGAIGGAVYATLFSKTEIDLAKYVTFEFEGYDGYASFNKEDLKIDEKGLKSLLESKSLASKLSEKLLDKVQVEENENLKNGDTVEVKFKVSESWLKDNKLKLSSTKINIKVKDLEEPNTINLFKDIEFSYSGISPDLTVSLKNNSKDDFIKNKVSFSMEKSKDSSTHYSLYDVANGDKIKVKASYSEESLKSAGYVVKENEFEFTVEGQAEYITSADSINNDIKATISEKSLAKAKSISNSSNYDLTRAYHEDFSDASHYNYNLSHTDPEFVKMYIAINNDLDNISYSDSRNKVYSIYKVTFTDSTTSKSYDYFITVEVKDLVTDSKGLYTEKTYYYDKFDNSQFIGSDGNDFHRSETEVYNAITDKLGTKYTLTEVK